MPQDPNTCSYLFSLLLSYATVLLLFPSKFFFDFLRAETPHHVCFACWYILMHGLLGCCYGLNICFPSRFTCWNPNHQGDSCGVSTEWLNHETRALKNEIRALIRNHNQFLHYFFFVRIQLSMSETVDHHKLLNGGESWSWPSEPPEPWAVHFCSL